jgi:S-DNA-T family DNA segregation ATPase FtsK/SpoIIIE
MAAAIKNPNKSKSNEKQAFPKVKNNLLEGFNRFKLHFGRFLVDVTGVLLISFGLLILVGISGLSNGVLLSRMTSFISTWLGWGSFILAGLAILLGAITFKHRRNPVQIHWKQVVSFEITCFLTLAVLSIFGGNSLRMVENGWWGGRIGWGLSALVQKLIGKFPGTIFIFLLWGLTIIGSFGLWDKLEIWLQKKSGDLPVSDNPPVGIGEQVDPELSEIEEKKPRTSKKRSKPNIPVGFRKQLSLMENKDVKSANPPLRGEILPPINILIHENNIRPDERNINQTAGLIEKTLADFGIPAKVIGFRVGPTITQFAVEPGFFEKGGSDNGDPNRQKVRIAQIAALSRDLALALSAERLRIEAPVPGQSFVGIEVPNSRAATVRLRPILESEIFNNVGSPLAIALGRDVSGQPLVCDLARMPHILVAGTTGSGKSVCISALATCLAMNNSPDQLRLVMIDSKMVELIRFNGLPHLYGKVETNIQRILGVLRWIVLEMEQRYKLLEAARVRDLDGYNKKIAQRKDKVALPRIIVLIDELADLMMSAPDQTEHNLVRLAQMARATGIHLVVATQRPSTEVVTGLIKANFPARLSFAVASGIDSRVILDTQGAENLLGKGDMLFINPEVGIPVRAQGVLVTDQEIERMIAFWQKASENKNEIPPWETLLREPDEGEDDILIEHAITLLRKEHRASASLLQRRLRIGYPRAARLLDRLEEMGIVGPSSGGGRDRDVLIESDEREDDSI